MSAPSPVLRPLMIQCGGATQVKQNMVMRLVIYSSQRPIGSDKLWKYEMTEIGTVVSEDEVEEEGTTYYQH